ncbi:MAG: hypothetical protein ACLP8S_14895 [Solirubrobacteraceae bacterium]
MIPAIDVVLDSEDELATTQAIHRLAAAEPGVLAVRIAPDARTTPALIWAILRPLGKRLENLAGEAPTSHMAQTWLKAHQITELVVLHAQHLTPARDDELTHLIEPTVITATLIYTGHGATDRHATTTLATLLARPRRSCPSEARAAPWPEVPVSHPLRLRHDCRLALSEDEFRRVDGLLFATYNLERWLLAHPRATDEQLHRAVDVMRIAHDPSQRHIRACAITAALNSAGIAPPPPGGARPFKARVLRDRHIDQALAYSHALEAGYTLSKHLTGFPPDLLHIIGGDQIIDDAIIGCRVPERARPILRALIPRYSGPVLGPPRWPAAAQPSTDYRNRRSERSTTNGNDKPGCQTSRTNHCHRSGFPMTSIPESTRVSRGVVYTDRVLDLSGKGFDRQLE